MPDANHTTGVEYRTISDVVGYRFGDNGTVQSCVILGGPKPRLGNVWTDLKLTTTGRGYQVVGVRRNGRIRVFQVGFLVLEAFVGPKPPDMECCHGDGDPLNNRLDNLRWDTHQSNEDDKKRHGTRPKGSGHAHAKLTEDQVREIRDIYARGGITKIGIARAFGLHHSTVLNILSRKGWRHVA